LQKNGYIRLLRVDRPEKGKRGRGKQVWEVTLAGIFKTITIINDFGYQLDFDKIAENHKNKWLIFSEWKYLTQDPEMKNEIINSIYGAAGENIGRYIDFSFGSREAQQAFMRTKAFFDEGQMTNAALLLDPVFLEGAVPPWIFENENQNDLLVRLWKHAIKNPRIREFVEHQFKLEKEVHTVLLRFEEWLLNSMREKA